jgi:hypothetical protein
LNGKTVDVYASSATTLSSTDKFIVTTDFVSSNVDCPIKSISQNNGDLELVQLVSGGFEVTTKSLPKTVKYHAYTITVTTPGGHS